jgi:hypothetical protein
MADEAENKNGRAMREIVQDASLLREKRKELDTLRLQDNSDWSLNKEFHRGNQWVYWNKNAGRVESLGVDRSELPRYKVRLTANEITIGTQQLVAQMTKTRPVIRAVPETGGDRDVKAAQFAERLYENWWQEFGLHAKLQSALVNAQVSQGYWLITWDELAGSSMKVMLNPETGEEIHDEDLADILRDELRSQAEELGIDPKALLSMFEQTIYMGDVNVRVMDGTNVWVDPTVSNFEDARYFIARIPMDVDEIEARYGKRVTPDASSSEAKPALQMTKTKDERPKNVRDVYCLYHRPSPSLPKGAYVKWIEGPNEILASGDWQEPFSQLNLVKFPGIERPGSVYDDPRITQARPVQEELNNKVSKVAMHMNLTLKPQMMAQVGSLRQRLTDEPGAVFEWAGNIAPEWRPIPSIPSHTFAYIESLQARLGRIFNQMPTERSALPARTDSGQLVELVQEAVADQIAPEIIRMEWSLAQAGQLMAAYAQEFYTETRSLKIAGPGGSVKSEKFRNVDLAGGFSFHPEAGSGLPRTRAGRVQQLREMVEMGAATIQDIVPYLPIAGLKTVESRLQSDEDFAFRKITKLLRGEPLNVPAMMQAVQVVESTGMNPQTGEMFQSPDEAIAFVEQAALQPHPFENLQATAVVLSQHMKSAEFEKYEPDVQARFLQHFEMIRGSLAESAVSGEPVKTTLSLKGTVGPTVAADILKRNGIQAANAETMAEPPLETSVYDSVDKVDADGAGNDPMSDIESQMAMRQSEEVHQLRVAKAAHELAKAEAADDREEEDAQITRERDEEVHQERVRQMQKPEESDGE